MQIWRKKLTKVCDFEKGIMGKERDGEGEIDEKEGRKRETKEWKEENKRIRRNVRARD